MDTTQILKFVTDLEVDEIPEYLAKLDVIRWNLNSIFKLSTTQNITQLQLLNLKYSLRITDLMISSQYTNQMD